MDFVGDFKCPQYVDFKEEFDNNYDSLTDAEVSACSTEQDTESESMHIDDETSKSYYFQDKISHSENVQSTSSESYLPDSNYQGSSEGFRDSEYQAEEFPVNHPKHFSLPEKERRSTRTKKTEAKPFHLNESKNRKRKAECNEYVSMAEQVAAFHRKTPKRFHSSGPRAYEPAKHWSPNLIQPKSPNLQAVKRNRGVNVLSREEQEAKEAEEMKRYRFRAQPVKYNKLRDIQLPEVGKKLPTKPKNLHLRTAQRAATLRASKKNEEEKSFEFHARPVPKAITNGPAGLKEKPSLHVTEPKTPNFALKKRAEKWKNENKLKELAPETQKFKAMPAPTATSPFVVKHEKKCTEIQPFSFETKDKERLAQKEQKINEEIEKENRVFVFKAQPMPSPAPSVLPAVPKKPRTIPEPFNLCSESRSFKHSFNSSDQTGPTFKAQPATVLQKPPFVPEKSLKLPIETKEFHLHTDVRAVKRQKLKEENDIKEHEKELLLQQLKQIQEEEERLEILKIRKEAVHKANPVRHFKPFELKPSNKALTQPVSPKFHTDERLQMRHNE